MRVTLKDGFVAIVAWQANGHIILQDAMRRERKLTPLQYAKEWASGVLHSQKRTTCGLLVEQSDGTLMELQ